MDIARSSLKVFVSNVGGAVVLFLGIAFFARELGAAQLGVFFLFQALLRFLSLPATLGLNTAIIKRISEGRSPEQTLSTGLVLKLVLLSVIVPILVAASPILNEYLGAELALLLAVTLVVQEVAEVMIDALEGELRVGETAIITFTHSVTWIGVGAILVTRGYGATGLAYALLIGYAAELALAAYKVETGIGSPSRDLARSLVNYSKYATVSDANGYMHSWMDILVISFFLAPAAVGVYEVAWQVAAPVLLFTSAISTTIFPQISSWEATGSIEAVERLFSRVVTPAVLLTIPAFFGVLLLSREILELVYGPEYTAAWLVLIILVGGKIPRAIRILAGNSLFGLNRPDYVTRAALVDIIGNLVLNFVLIWQFGIVGAAVATVVSMTAGTVVRTYYLSQLMRLRVRYDEILWCVGSATGMYLVLYAMKQRYPVDSLPTLLAFVVAGVAIYGALVSLHGSMRSQLWRHAIEQF
ncbi:flippase [Natrinema marinum]|uniref:flippase n=1 Tax=Natrinema marinum TaxID=2961598 RepID=UPI0020C892D3|nr:flippase [Natrinema marinum]